MLTKLTKSRLATMVPAAAAVLLLGACGADDPQGATTGRQVAAPTGSVVADLSTASNDQLGEIVVDGEGRTLYRFDRDTTNPPVSNCVDACAELWPPVMAGEKVSVDGIDAGLVGTVDRPDGSQQLALNGWALYRFAEDKQPGDTNGQGVDGAWFASTTTGGKAAAGQPQQDDQPEEQSDNQPDDDSQSDDDSGYGY